jgi:hypothetical protein
MFPSLHGSRGDYAGLLYVQVLGDKVIQSDLKRSVDLDGNYLWGSSPGGL